MYALIDDVPSGVIGIDASGVVTADDYAKFMPLLEAAIETDGRIRLLMRFGADFRHFDRRAALRDAMATAVLATHIERIALVTDIGFVRTLFETVSPAPPEARRIFPIRSFSEAVTWVSGTQD